MAKKALCVGVDHYENPRVSSLNGCVNDARAWAETLVKHFEFAPADVMFLADEQATKAQVLAAMNALIEGSAPGDVLVYVNASHGVHASDPASEEESDKLDEVVCTYDYPTQVLLDDDLRDYFVAIPEGVFLTVISDSCHSGTVTRLALPGIPTLDMPDLDIANRTFEPATVTGREPPQFDVVEALDKSAAAKRGEYPESAMRELLLAGCLPSQTSKERFLDGAYHGVMSHCALKALQENNYSLTYRQLHELLVPAVAAVVPPDQKQEPQLEGSDAFKDRRVFS